MLNVPRHPSRCRSPIRLAGLVVLLAPIGACRALANLPGAVDLSSDRNDIMSLPAADEPVPQETTVVPLDDGADWIQLDSGEWLRGKLTRIRRGNLHFDSDELGDQSFDAADVKRIRTAEPQVVVTKDSKTLQGKLALDGDQVWVEGEQTVLISRNDILATLAFDGRSPVDWRGKVTLGATVRSGNTKQDDTSAFVELVRETARTRWRNTYTGASSRANDTETANNHRLRSIHDVALTERLFVTVPSIDLYVDKFQNLDYRVTAAVLVGYEVLMTPKHEWRLSLGPAYQYTRFETTTAGQEPQDETAAMAALSSYSWDVSSNVDLQFDYSITAPVPETDEYNHNFVVKLSVDLIANLELDIAFVWDRVNKPIEDGSGNVPVPDDYRTTIGLGWSF